MDICPHLNFDARRGTGPRPTVNGDDFLFFTVGRGPVPRDLPPSAKNVRNPETTDVRC